MDLDPEVERALVEQVPLFYRKLARKALENYAREKGVDRVTMEIFLEAKAKYLGGTASDK